jgi:hypothetical protein
MGEALTPTQKQKTAGRLWNGTPPYPRDLSLYVPLLRALWAKALEKWKYRNKIYKKKGKQKKNK